MYEFLATFTGEIQRRFSIIGDARITDGLIESVCFNRPIFNPPTMSVPCNLCYDSFPRVVVVRIGYPYWKRLATSPYRAHIRDYTGISPIPCHTDIV